MIPTAACKACGGTMRSSKGGDCYPCVVSGRLSQSRNDTTPDTQDQKEPKPMQELHLSERPRKLGQVVGQKAAVAQLTGLAKSESGIPHALLFTGPSGCGKTTLARIVRHRLKCADVDFQDINAAENRGIDMVRSIQARMTLSPLGGESRVYLIDEAHQLTADAQGALLKMLEEPPAHVYFMLATTHPEKLRKAIKTRATEISVSAVAPSDLAGLISRTAEKHGRALDSDVIEKAAGISDGSPRKALVLLQQVVGIPDKQGQLDALDAADAEQNAIEIPRALLRTNTTWKAMVAILKTCDEEPERIRRLVLSYATKVALGGRDSARAIEIIEEFEDNFFDSGKAGLTRACYNIVASE